MSAFALLQFLAKRWFLIALTILFVVGLLGAAQLKLLADWKWLRQTNLFVVMFITALPLEARSIWRTLKRPLAPAIALTMTYGLLPLLAWGLSNLISDPSLSGGLLVASVTPCTVASAAVWTRRALGNDGVAIVSTVLTNLACFIVPPLWLAVMLRGTPASGALDAGKLMIELLLLVVLPMVLAQLARLHGAVAEFAARRKQGLSTLSQCGILLMVLFGAINSGLIMQESGAELTGAELAQQGLQIAIMVALVLSIHTGVFFVGYTLTQRLGLPRADAIAVGFSGSQKTLMVGLEIAIASQLSILPMITFHAG
ncbi:MAG TPA: bile acid:sodium symporter, partial [Pirellulaceae bacterium]|nr:bile acid:sodium symporter [Pirellulaceae bacterium]